LLAKLHAGGHPLARLETLGKTPVAIGKNGQVVVALDWDYIAWTPEAADFIAELKTARLERKPPTGYLLALSGEASPMFQRKLKADGIKLVTRAAPGPLK